VQRPCAPGSRGSGKGGVKGTLGLGTGIDRIDQRLRIDPRRV
jgi:hypothetical protein